VQKNTKNFQLSKCKVFASLKIDKKGKAGGIQNPAVSCQFLTTTAG